MGEYSLPQPDVTVVRKQVGFAPPAGGLLVVEVADTSLRKELDTKSKIYAAAGVREYWLVDVQGEKVFVFSEPHGLEYRQIQVIPRSGVLQPIDLPGVTVAVDELFRANP